MIDPAYVLILLQAASKLSGYSIPTTPPPQVIELTTEQMDAKSCEGHNKDDTLCLGKVGLYRDGDTIWIDAQWTGSKDALASEDSYIVHELTHWLQNEHAWGGLGCPHIDARESEAYRVQNKYIQLYEHKSRLLSTPEICGI